MKVKVKVKEDEKMDVYMEITREFKKLWKMRMLVILFAVEALETILKNQEKRFNELKLRGIIMIIIPNTESVLENKTYKHYRDFEI